jgi:transposase
MKHYSEVAVERMMKVQEVILRAIAGKLRRWEAAEILGVSDRTMRRWRWRYQQHGYDALYDRRKGKPSPKRVPLKTVEKVLQLYRQEYANLGDYFLSRSCLSSCQRLGVQLLKQIWL